MTAPPADDTDRRNGRHGDQHYHAITREAGKRTVTVVP